MARTSLRVVRRARDAAGTPEAPPASTRRAKIADLWLGTQLRSLRKAKGLSLMQVAQGAELSIGMVSQIERGLASPSIRSLRKLADTLGVPVAWFFHVDAARPAAELDKVVRRDDRRQLRVPTVGTNADLFTMELLTPDLSGALELMLMTLEPGFNSGPPHHHRGEEAGLVVAGALDLWVDQDRFTLKEGDSFRFASTSPHRYANAADRVTKIVWALTPPLV